MSRRRPTIRLFGGQQVYAGRALPAVLPWPEPRGKLIRVDFQRGCRLTPDGLPVDSYWARFARSPAVPAPDEHDGGDGVA